jgi:hypothetical protein
MIAFKVRRKLLMHEKDILHYSSISEENPLIASVRSDILNSSLTIFLDHTVFDHYRTDVGFRGKVIYIRDKFNPQIETIKEDVSEENTEKGETERNRKVGVILKIQHNETGAHFFIRAKVGGDFEYISKGNREKDKKYLRKTHPESVNNKLRHAMEHPFPGRKRE